MRDSKRAQAARDGLKAARRALYEAVDVAGAPMVRELDTVGGLLFTAPADWLPGAPLGEWYAGVLHDAARVHALAGAGERAGAWDRLPGVPDSVARSVALGALADGRAAGRECVRRFMRALYAPRAWPGWRDVAVTVAARWAYAGACARAVEAAARRGAPWAVEWREAGKAAAARAGYAGWRAAVCCAVLSTVSGRVPAFGTPPGSVDAPRAFVGAWKAGGGFRAPAPAATVFDGAAASALDGSAGLPTGDRALRAVERMAWAYGVDADPWGDPVGLDGADPAATGGAPV